MTVDPQKTSNCLHSPVIKLHSGANVVNVKPVFSYDSKQIILASGFDVKIFSIASGECFCVLKGHEAVIVGIHINPENKLQFFSCSEDGIVLRWDYTEGKLLQKYNLNCKTFGFWVSPRSKVGFAVCPVKFDNEFQVYSVTLKDMKRNALMRLNWTYIDNCLAFSTDGKYLAAINKNVLDLHDVVYDKNNTKNYKRLIRRHMKAVPFTCVAWHPTDLVVATGNITGSITVWTNVTKPNPTRSEYHWHHLPLPDLLFSHKGSHIYSGGGESVLLKWTLNSETKDPFTLPRLGLPICRLAISDDNRYISVAHIDNALEIVAPGGSVVQIIQGLTRGYCDNDPQNLRGMRLLYDPRSTALVLNGRPGHLQFYDTSAGKQLFQLDIVNQNFCVKERNIIIYNTEVVKFAIDDQGLWLATVECRDDKETSPEIRLKFWQFELSSQKFVLNTNVFLPHNKSINCLKFQPVYDSNEDFVPLAVTTSNDKRFKVWTLSGKHNEKLCWTCEFMSYYKDIPAGDACFSEDGSLLCVVFNCFATLWTPDTNRLKASLCHPSTMDPIISVLFGHGDCSHLLISHTKSMLSLWNVLTLSVVWNVNCNIVYLVDDHISGVMAAFTEEKNLFVFKPASAKPITIMKNISTSPVVSAVFLPHGKTNETCCWQGRSKLFILNQNQELLMVDNATDEDEHQNRVFLKQSLPVTPFGLLKAEEATSDVKQVKQIQHILHGADIPDTSEPMELPCPSYVNPVLLCKTSLPLLLNVTTTTKRNSKYTSNKSKKQQQEETSDSEEEKRDKKKIVPKKVESKVENSTAKSEFSKDYHYLLTYI